MSAIFEELAARATDLGELSLRRRREPTLGVDVYEVKLGDEFLMSSLFTAAEVELARHGLAAVTGSGLDVVVGGLGLGYTARTVLDDERVHALTVVEALEDVIEWHERRLLPDVSELTRDPRTRLVHGDFFAMAAGSGDRDEVSRQRVDAILVDIDHTPRHHLHPSHASFYGPSGLAGLGRWLRPEGVFALWSDDPPDAGFTTDLGEAFGHVEAHVVSFPNPLTGGESANTVYVASRPRRDTGRAVR